MSSTKEIITVHNKCIESISYFENLIKEHRDDEEGTGHLENFKLLLRMNFDLAAENEGYRQKTFGRKKEDILEPNQFVMDLFSFLGYSFPSESTIKEDGEQSQEIEIKAHKRRSKKKSTPQDSYENLPEIVEDHKLEGEDLLCDCCGREMEHIGPSGNSSVEVVYEPPKLYAVRHQENSYKCNHCSKGHNLDCIGVDHFKKSHKPRRVISHGICSATLLAEVLRQKFVMFSPFNRQEKYWASLGLKLSRDTMANWTISVAESYLVLIYNLMMDKIKQESILHIDETPYNVLASDKSKCYFWLIRTIAQCKTPIVLYNFDESRPASVIKDILNDFEGIIHTDVYAAYNDIEGVVSTGCGAHIRRSLYEGGGKYKDSSVQWAVQMCNKMFKVEEDIKTLNLKRDQILPYRQQHLKPLIDRFDEWLHNLQPQVGTASKLGKAINYSIKELDKLKIILENPDVAISNDLAERSIRPVAIDRKNWMFSTSIKGAKANGIVMSIIETAKENGLAPYKYLVLLFEDLPNLLVLNSQALGGLFTME